MAAFCIRRAGAAAATAATAARQAARSLPAPSSAIPAVLVTRSALYKGDGRLAFALCKLFH